MLVVVAGRTYNLADKDLVGSQTLKDLLHSQYVSRSDTEAIPIMVDLSDWQNYLMFLFQKTASIAALRVINYLDNLQQAQEWCLHRSFKIVFAPKSLKQADKESRQELIDIINEITEYLPAQVMPFRLLTNFEEILTRIQAITPGHGVISTDVTHIVETLFSRRIQQYYNEISLKEFDSLSFVDVSSLLNNMFIFKAAAVHSNDKKILRQPSIDYYINAHDSQVISLHGQVEFISPRIAQYYSNITVYQLIGKNYIYCPNSRPFLEYHETISLRTVDTLDVSCQQQRPEWNKSLPLDVYTPFSSYRPGSGFATGITLKYHDDNSDDDGDDGDASNNVEYELRSYNEPSTYSRGRVADQRYPTYIFLPYEYDPIAKIVYAFSV